MSSEDNKMRAHHGIQAKRTLDYIVTELESYGALSGHKDKPAYGYDNYEKSQFKADKEVTASDGTRYILYSTNSIRSDRVKGQQWDAYNIKQINGKIEQAYIIIPDENALKGSGSFRQKIREGLMYSAIDDIFTIDEFYESEIEKYSSRLNNGLYNISHDETFERRFCDVLVSTGNLERFNGDGIETGYHYEVFYKVMGAIGFERRDVVSIFATTDVPALSNGTKQKVDIIAKFFLSNGEHRIVTFSLRSISNLYEVIHQATADEFANVLDNSNDYLCLLLNMLQDDCIGFKEDPELAEALSNEISPYLYDLDRWVFSGGSAIGSGGLQIVQYIVAFTSESFGVEIRDVESYCRIQEKLSKKATDFGTCFQWRCVESPNGNRIQLRAKIVP